MQALTQADTIQQFPGGLAWMRRLRQFERQHHVFECGQAMQQLEILEHKTDHLGPELCAPVFIKLVEIAAINNDLAV